MLQSNASARAGRMAVSGRHFAFSHLDTAWGLTCSRSARASPVYPRSLRRDAILLAIFSKSIIVFYLQSVFSAVSL